MFIERMNVIMALESLAFRRVETWEKMGVFGTSRILNGGAEVQGLGDPRPGRRPSLAGEEFL